MKLKDYTFNVKRGESMTFYVIGDAHVGSKNCAEEKLKVLVDIIKADPNARWFGGGDLTENIVPSDSKRFDPTVLPDWMLDNRDADDVVMDLKDIIGAQLERLYAILDPIKDKCLGLIEGNHEYSIMKYHNRDIMNTVCKHFKVANLTDCAYLRFNFRRGKQETAVVRAFITHGHGGGRTSGAEPNCLYRLAADKDCDIVWKGHSHTFAMHPPIPMLTIPKTGPIPENATTHYKYAANWGAYVYTYQSGSGSYASRANYPVRPMYTVSTVVTPEPSICPEYRVEQLPVHL